MKVEQAQSGLESLALSQKTISQLRQNFISIEKYVLILPILFLFSFLKDRCFCIIFLVWFNNWFICVLGYVKNVKLWSRIMIR